MKITIDPGSMEPPFQQIARQIREAIAGGEYAPGDLLPSKRWIHEETGISVKTVTKAMDLLKEEGLVATVQGMGAFVAVR